MLPIKKNIFIAFFTTILFFQYGCQQTTTSPTQSSILEKFYTIGSKQIAADIIRTSDGGYVMAGTVFANSSDPEGDILVLKVDSLGVEEWHKMMGKAPAPGTGNLAGKHIKYHEEGVKIVELPNGTGYTVAANRTYVAYPNSSSTSGTHEQTKIVFYKLNNTGVPSNTDGYELMNHHQLTDKIADFKMDGNNYILTGFTEMISTVSPTAGTTDILTALLDNNFNLLWQQGSLAYGFDGKDYGTSVQILPNAYLICGTSEEKYSDTSGNNYYVPQLIVVKMTKVGGVPVNPQFYGDQTHAFEGGYSTYNSNNQIITILGNVKGGTSANTGKLAILQVEQAGLSAQTPNPSVFGMQMISPTAPTSTSINNRFKAQSIAELPNNGGFLISSTMTDNLSQDICVSKLDNNLVPATTNWPYYHGYASGQMTSPGNEVAATVLPVIDNGNVTGTAFTGTIDNNTPTSKIAWVKF